MLNLVPSPENPGSEIWSSSIYAYVPSYLNVFVV